MNENYTTQVLGSTSDAENFEAIFPQMEYLSNEIRKMGKRKKTKGKKGKHNKKLKKQIKAIAEQQQLMQQLLAFVLWQSQASGFVVGSPKKKKKKKSGTKTPKWLEQVLIQSLPQVITTGFDRLLPPPQSQPMLALPDGRNHKQ